MWRVVRDTPTRRATSQIGMEGSRSSASVEAEGVVVPARLAAVVSVETFVADFRRQTRQGRAMTGLTVQHTRATSVGESSLRV